MGFVGSVNQATTNADTALVALNALKTALQAAGWTIQGSGNGAATFSNNAVPGPAATDNTGNFANNNSWVRLREPSPGTREYVFLRGSATSLLAKYSRSSGFGTGGSATTCPTTGASGDGCVIWGTSLGFSATGSSTNTYDMGATNNTSAASFQSGAANHRLSVIASNTPSNGVWGWWLVAWVEGSGASSFFWYTDAIDPLTCPSNDYDPSYRQQSGTSSWWGYDIATINRVNYWQGYPASWSSPAVLANYRYDGTGLGLWAVWTTGYNAASWVWPSGNATTPALNPYNDKNFSMPILINTQAVPGVPPKGMAMNTTMTYGVFNLEDTLDLTTSYARIIVASGPAGGGTWYLTFPWLTNILPVV